MRNGTSRPWMKFAPLPKAEYLLARELAEKYGVINFTGKPNWQEFFTVLIRLVYEIDHREGGEDFIQQTIATLRNYPDEERTYEVINLKK